MVVGGDVLLRYHSYSSLCYAVVSSCSVTLGFLYFGTMKYFIPSVSRTQRLDATSRSPVFSAFGEARRRHDHPRAFRAEERFSRDQSSKLRTNFRAYFLGTACNRWLAVRLEFLGTLTTVPRPFGCGMGNTAPYKGRPLTDLRSQCDASVELVRAHERGPRK